MLHKHPAVEDVQVVGVPDERLGEEICAIIRLKSGAQQPSKESIIEFVKVALKLCYLIVHLHFCAQITIWQKYGRIYDILSYSSFYSK